MIGFTLKAARHLCCGMLFFSLSAMAQAPGRTDANPESLGFEIGNGKRIIRNLNGMYGLRIFGSWEASISDKFTEVITSLSDGTPRARLQINMVQAESIRTFNDLVDLFLGKAKGWTVAKIGDLEAVQKEANLSTGRCVLDVRVFKAPQEIAVINLDAAPKCDGPSAYAKIKASLDTFYFIK